jgi:hypothetical protein
LSRAVGGVPNETKLLTSFEKLLARWNKYANEEGLDLMTIHEVKSELQHYFHQLRGCRSSCQDTKILSNFLKQNSDIILTKVDKSSDIAIYKKNVYDCKLRKEFPNSKFKKLANDPINTDTAKYQNLIRDFRPYISKTTYNDIRVSYKLKRSYGLAKLHKRGEPFRPIVGSTNSITSGLEGYLVEILSKLEKKICKYSINSTKMFKNIFMKFNSKMDQTYQFVSFDVKNMYPSIPLKKAIDYIINKIYQNPTTYFLPEEVNGEGVLFPPQNIFRRLLEGALSTFTAFESTVGTFRQTGGCSMGSSLSPIVANIFMNSIETEFLDRCIAEQKILYVVRYVDDFCAVVKNDSVSEIFNQMNKLDKNIEITMEKMENNKLAFLDTQILKSENLYSITMYQKPGKSNSLLNFQNPSSPKSQKISTLTGEIHRIYNCCSNPENLEESLERLKSKFVANLYPVTLIEKKITEMRQNNFITPPNKTEFDIKYFFKCEFTSPKCYTIGLKMKQLIRRYTPRFLLNIAWRTLRLESVIHGRLKRPIPFDNKAGLVYQWDCPCSQKYIGETCRPLGKRMYEHTRSDTSSFTNNSAIGLHLKTCSIFKEKLVEVNETSQTAKMSSAVFAKKFFAILQSNLYSYSDRKYAEAFYIKVRVPSLNIQVKAKEWDVYFIS